ncbi:MAG: histidyl-tRNA synthetase [Candidatus Tokpelaia sp. JSC188]|nr:MAG: histidyl-tRNA synthetase [Candidatus Tokpelaia sp. JSC188]
MASKARKIRAKLPSGFIDKTASDLRAEDRVMTAIREVYELYGFEPIETPLIEYTDALGKFLPDQNRPNTGVFSFQDDDEQWLSLRYDLTTPLARYVAEHFEEIPKPSRTYRAGWVFRNEKPGTGRFRQFLQFDADTVGVQDIIADAEICMMAADALERIGIKRGDYVIRINNRKVLNGLLEVIGLRNEKTQRKQLTILRAIDKIDKFGPKGVALLLGKGRLDESGDFTKGADLDASAVKCILDLIASETNNTSQVIDNLRKAVGKSANGLEGIAELEEMQSLFAISGYEDRMKIDPSVVRGLEYYTGSVFEANLLFDLVNENRQKVVFGSVGGGGRYDGLIAHFCSQPVPATGFSIGVSRLVTTLKNLEQFDTWKNEGPVIILVMDREHEALAGYQRIVADLRSAGVRAEIYMGDAGIKAQMKYADRREAPCVIIQGSIEREAGTVEIKNLIEGARLSKKIKDNETWRKQRPAQITVSQNQIVPEVKRILASHVRERRKDNL